jgi:hypothetical protein
VRAIGAQPGRPHSAPAAATTAQRPALPLAMPCAHSSPLHPQDPPPPAAPQSGPCRGARIHQTCGSCVSSRRLVCRWGRGRGRGRGRGLERGRGVRWRSLLPSRAATCFKRPQYAAHPCMPALGGAAGRRAAGGAARFHPARAPPLTTSEPVSHAGMLPVMRAGTSSTCGGGQGRRARLEAGRWADCARAGQGSLGGPARAPPAGASQAARGGTHLLLSLSKERAARRLAGRVAGARGRRHRGTCGCGGAHRSTRARPLPLNRYFTEPAASRGDS